MRGYRWRGSRPESLGATMFGSAGWLFADLMLALAVLLLVANTIAFHQPVKRVQHNVRGHHPVVKHSPPGLDPHYVSFRVAISPEAVQSEGAATIATVLQGVDHQLAIRHLTAHQVGFVIVLAAGADDGIGQGNAIRIADAVVKALRDQDRAFSHSAGIGYWGGTYPDDFKFDVFFLT